jgi:HSP20 family molecular chaperone IbpA
MSDTNVTKSTADNTRSDVYMTPAVDVIEDATGITLYADLPGVPKDKLNLQVEVDALTIEGEVTLSAPDGLKSLHAEVSLPRYRRAFTLSKELDVEKVSAEFNQGVLKLHIPKAAQAQPRKINVNVH